MKEVFVIMSIIIILILHNYMYVVQADKNKHSSYSPIFAYDVHDATIGNYHKYNYLLLPQEQRRRLSDRLPWATSKIRHALKKYKKPMKKDPHKGHFPEKDIRVCSEWARSICVKKYDTEKDPLVLYQMCHEVTMIQCLNSGTIPPKA